LNHKHLKFLLPERFTVFEINRYKKECLINGFNDIDYLINIKDRIVNYETRKGLTI